MWDWLAVQTVRPSPAPMIDDLLPDIQSTAWSAAMSGVIGHMMYAVLAAKAAEQRKLPIAAVVGRHFASYLAGSYLGSDIQTLPAAVCQDTGKEVGYGTTPPERSPLTGGPVTGWKLEFQGQAYTPQDVYRMFYGRGHLLFGWDAPERDKRLRWEQLPGYLAAAAGDAIELFGPGERPLAYVFGWATHLAGDSLIKSVQPGVTLHLLNGKYTPENRPIQDLVTFHEVGRKELRLNWAALLTDAAQTPVEPVQCHYMRVARPAGRLAWYFPGDWVPEQEALLGKVLEENRRYQRIRNAQVLKEMELREGPDGPACDPELSRQTGGLRYSEMVRLADEAGFRHALWQIAEAIADLFEQAIREQPLLQSLPLDSGPTWEELTRRWRHP
jgi:hypothetical protein